jgi:formylglycine-generating enzyme
VSPTREDLRSPEPDLGGNIAVNLDSGGPWRCPGEVGKPFTSHRALSVLAGLAAVVVGFSAGCGSSGSNSQGSDAGGNDATSSSSSGGSGSGSGSGSSSSSGGSNGSSGSSRGESGSTPPNCAPGGPGLTNCGASQESCCTSLEVTGGTYYRTYDPFNYADGGIETAADGGPTGEADPATVSAFRLDKYLVTVGRFRQFVNAWGAGWRPAPGSGKHTHLNGGLGLVNVSDDAGVAYETGWVALDDGNIAPTSANLTSCNGGGTFPLTPYATWTPVAGSNETLPINCVNWQEAYAFCIWDGGFLPSEAEWEYAAAGGSQQRAYPWGSTPPGTASQYATYGCLYPNGPVDGGLGSCTGVTNIAPVGTTTLGAGLWGQFDLAGDMWEWNLDWYAPYADPCTDCASLTGGSGRVFRAGTFTDATILRPSYRNYLSSQTWNALGLRCARTP